MDKCPQDRFDSSAPDTDHFPGISCLHFIMHLIIQWLVYTVINLFMLRGFSTTCFPQRRILPNSFTTPICFSMITIPIILYSLEEGNRPMTTLTFILIQFLVINNAWALMQVMFKVSNLSIYVLVRQIPQGFPSTVAGICCYLSK